MSDTSNTPDRSQPGRQPGVSEETPEARSPAADPAPAGPTLLERLVGLFRQKNGKKEVARFELDDIRAGKANDPDLLANDLVVVETSAGKVAFNNLTKMVPVATLFRPF